MLVPRKVHIFTDIDRVMNDAHGFSSASEVKICRRMRRSKILPHNKPCDEVQLFERFGGGTLPETNSSHPENRTSPKATIVFQPSIFQVLC